MEFHGIDCVGPFLMEEVEILPTFDSLKDERRLVYNKSDGKIYYGKDNQWSLSESDMYVVDYNVVDQGINTTRSVKNFVDFIDDKESTLIFRNNSGNSTTEYIFNTNETIPNNITCIIERGAIIKPSFGVTVTIESQPDIGLYTVFGGDGTVICSKGPYIFVSTVEELISYTPISGLWPGVVELSGIHNSGDGAIKFIWDNTVNRSTHDGYTVIDPTHSVGIVGWVVPENTSVGCWVVLRDSVINDTVDANLNLLIQDLKQEGLWDKFDLLYVPCLNTWELSKINWKSPGSYNLLQEDEDKILFMPLKGTANLRRHYIGWSITDRKASQGPTFDRVTGGGSLRTGWNPSIDAINFKATSSHVSVYLTAHGGTKDGVLFSSIPADDDAPDVGLRNSSSIRFHVHPDRQTHRASLCSDFTDGTFGTSFIGTIGDEANNLGLVKSYVGFHCVSRNGSVLSSTHNGIEIGDRNIESTTDLPDDELVFLSALTGLPNESFHSGHTISFASVGDKLTLIERRNLYRIVNKFLFSIGSVYHKWDEYELPKISVPELKGVESVKFAPMVDILFEPYNHPEGLYYQRSGEIMLPDASGFHRVIKDNELPHTWDSARGNYEGVRFFKGFDQFEPYSMEITEANGYTFTGFTSASQYVDNESPGWALDGTSPVWSTVSEDSIIGTPHTISKSYVRDTNRYFTFSFIGRDGGSGLRGYPFGVLVTDSNGSTHGVAYAQNGTWFAIVGDPTKVLSHKFTPLHNQSFRLTVCVDVGSGASDPVCTLKVYKYVNYSMDDLYTDGNYPDVNTPINTYLPDLLDENLVGRIRRDNRYTQFNLATGGTFTFSRGLSATTAPIAYDATPLEVRAALETIYDANQIKTVLGPRDLHIIRFADEYEVPVHIMLKAVQDEYGVDNVIKVTHSDWNYRIYFTSPFRYTVDPNDLATFITSTFHTTNAAGSYAGYYITFDSSTIGDAKLTSDLTSLTGTTHVLTETQTYQRAAIPNLSLLGWNVIRQPDTDAGLYNTYEKPFVASNGSAVTIGNSTCALMLPTDTNWNKLYVHVDHKIGSIFTEGGNRAVNIVLISNTSDVETFRFWLSTTGTMVMSILDSVAFRSYSIIHIDDILSNTWYRNISGRELFRNFFHSTYNYGPSDNAAYKKIKQGFGTTDDDLYSSTPLKKLAIGANFTGANGYDGIIRRTCLWNSDLNYVDMHNIAFNSNDRYPHQVTVGSLIVDSPDPSVSESEDSDESLPE